MAVALEDFVFYPELQLETTRQEEQRRGLGDLVGGSPAMQALYELIERLSATDVPVLIQGETGTGKGLVARTLHRRSRRQKGPLLHQNCGALPRELMESELFGHVRGAFTGASAERQGLFEGANGGVVFLDEIGEAPPEVQVRLLNVVEEGQVKRVGENRSRQVDVRVMAATNRDLEAEVRAGRFREDLFYRLQVLPLVLPPLREREEDIRLLAVHVLESCPEAREKGIQRIEQEAMRAFVCYAWPGNVRELENEIRRAVVLAEVGGKIQVEHLFKLILLLVGRMVVVTVSRPLKVAVQRFEQAAIEQALAQRGWNVTRTAKDLGLTRPGLQLKMGKYGIRRQVRVRG